MDTRTKLATGSVLATMGGLGIIFGHLLGFASLESPWSFVIGFFVGLLAGVGTGLALVGLVEMRQAR